MCLPSSCELKENGGFGAVSGRDPEEEWLIVFKDLWTTCFEWQSRLRLLLGLHDRLQPLEHACVQPLTLHCIISTQCRCSDHGWEGIPAIVVTSNLNWYYISKYLEPVLLTWWAFFSTDSVDVDQSRLGPWPRSALLGDPSISFQLLSGADSSLLRETQLLRLL